MKMNDDPKWLKRMAELEDGCDVRVGATPPELDTITDAVLAYRPKPKTKAAKRRKRKKARDAKKS